MNLWGRRQKDDWSTPSAPARPMLAIDVRSLLQQKNWSVSNLAYRWGLSVEYLSRLISDSHRPGHWNDAFLGLPTLSLLEAKSWSDERRRHRPPKERHRTTPDTPDLHGFRYHDYLAIGAEVEAIENGHGVDVGDRGIVVAVSTNSKNEAYTIKISGREMIFLPDDIDVLFVSTGRVFHVDQ